MNTRPNVNQQEAERTVRESLGLTADELGMNSEVTDYGDLGDDGDDDGGQDPSGNDRDRDALSDGDNLGTDRSRHVEQDDLTVQQDRQQQQPNQQQQQPDRIPAAAEIRTDGKGNLVDKKTGQVVARAGAEARMYQKMHKAVQSAQVMQAQNQDLTTRLNKAIELGTQMFERLKQHQENQGQFAPSRYGLADNEAIEALNFAKQAKTDPVGAIKAILTRASSGGIDLSSIGLQGGNFDPKSLLEIVRNEINTHMNPLKERSQRETAEQQQLREAQQAADAAKAELQTFIAKNPEARQYLPIFAEVYKQPQFQHMTLGEVWARVQLNLIRQGNQPDQRPANQQQRRNNNRVPNGRNRMPNGNDGRNNGLAPVEMSYEQIVDGLLPK